MKAIETGVEKGMMTTELRKVLDEVLPTSIQQGLGDLRYNMVCAYKFSWYDANSLVTYDRIQQT